MRLSPRFALDNLFVVAGAFLTVSAMVFSTAVVGWLGFGVFTGLTVVAGLSAVLARQMGQRIGHGVIGLVGIWSLVAALIFNGTALTWLVFAGAIALGVLALADMTANEMTTERVVHELAVKSAPAERASVNERIAA